MKQIDLSEVEEGKAIINYIVDRIKKGLGCNIIVVAPPGLGKSWLCLRIMELLYKKQFNSKNITKRHIVDDIADAFHFVRTVKRAGEPLTIEEMSVLAGSRRSMSSDNVSFNYLLDTCRKKQVVLLMNAPHPKFIDSHIKALCHVQLECLKIKKREKIVIVKPMKLQTNMETAKIYRHRFQEDGREVHRSFFGKPSKELIEMYEKRKDIFMDELYEIMEAKAKKKKEKVLIEIGRSTRQMQFKTKLTDKEAHVYREVMLKGRTMTDVAREEGVNYSVISRRVKVIKKKQNLLGKSENMTS